MKNKFTTKLFALSILAVTSEVSSAVIFQYHDPSLQDLMKLSPSTATEGQQIDLAIKINHLIDNDKERSVERTLQNLEKAVKKGDFKPSEASHIVKSYIEAVEETRDSKQADLYFLEYKLTKYCKKIDRPLSSNPQMRAEEDFLVKKYKNLRRRIEELDQVIATANETKDRLPHDDINLPHLPNIKYKPEAIKQAKTLLPQSLQGETRESAAKALINFAIDPIDLTTRPPEQILANLLNSVRRKEFAPAEASHIIKSYMSNYAPSEQENIKNQERLSKIMKNLSAMQELNDPSDQENLEYFSKEAEKLQTSIDSLTQLKESAHSAIKCLGNMPGRTRPQDSKSNNQSKNNASGSSSASAGSSSSSSGYHSYYDPKTGKFTSYTSNTNQEEPFQSFKEFWSSMNNNFGSSQPYPPEPKKTSNIDKKLYAAGEASPNAGAHIGMVANDTSEVIDKRSSMQIAQANNVGIAAGSNHADYYGAWLKVTGSKGKKLAHATDAANPGFNTKSGSIIVGLDVVFSDENSTIGVSYSFNDSQIKYFSPVKDSPKNGDKLEMQTYIGTLYGSFNILDNVFATAQINSGVAENIKIIDQDVNGNVYKGITNGKLFGGSTIIGYNHKLGNEVLIIPTIGINHRSVKINGTVLYANWITPSYVYKSYNSTRTAGNLGLSLQKAIDLNGTRITPEIHVGYDRTLSSKNNAQLVMFSSDKSLHDLVPTKEAKADKNTFNAGAAITLSTITRMELSLGYDFMKRNKFQGHTGFVKARINF